MTLRVAAIQHAMAEDWRANLATGRRLLAQAAADGARLAVFPEVHLSPFFPKRQGGDAEGYLMSVDHEAVHALQDAARELRMVIVANIYLEDENKRFDASPVIDADGTLRGVSRMVRIAHFEGFWEKDYYAPGDAIRAYDTAIGRLGVVICYDRHFPESYRAAALAGAEIVATPTCNEADEPLELFAWEMRVQAMHNHVFSMLVNRCGEEDGVRYAGRSLIAGPEGDEIARAGGDEAVLLADLDLGARQRSAATRGWLDEVRSGGAPQFTG